MPWESIGSVNTGESRGDEEWIEFCQKLAIQYIKLVCGNPRLGLLEESGLTITI